MFITTSLIWVINLTLKHSTPLRPTEFKEIVWSINKITFICSNNFRELEWIHEKIAKQGIRLRTWYTALVYYEHETAVWAHNILWTLPFSFPWPFPRQQPSTLSALYQSRRYGIDISTHSLSAFLAINHHVQPSWWRPPPALTVFITVFFQFFFFLITYYLRFDKITDFAHTTTI